MPSRDLAPLRPSQKRMHVSTLFDVEGASKISGHHSRWLTESRRTRTKIPITRIAREVVVVACSPLPAHRRGCSEAHSCTLAGVLTVARPPLVRASRSVVRVRVGVPLARCASVVERKKSFSPPRSSLPPMDRPRSSGEACGRSSPVTPTFSYASRDSRCFPAVASRRESVPG